jgi:hypothetical protein
MRCGPVTAGNYPYLTFPSNMKLGIKSTLSVNVYGSILISSKTEIYAHLMRLCTHKNFESFFFGL